MSLKQILLLSIRASYKLQSRETRSIKVQELSFQIVNVFSKIICRIDQKFINNYDYVFRLWECNLQQIVIIKINDLNNKKSNKTQATNIEDTFEIPCSYESTSLQFKNEKGKIIFTFWVGNQLSSIQNKETLQSGQIQLKKLNQQMNIHLQQCTHQINNYQQFLYYTNKVIKQLTEDEVYSKPLISFRKNSVRNAQPQKIISKPEICYQQIQNKNSYVETQINEDKVGFKQLNSSQITIGDTQKVQKMDQNKVEDQIINQNCNKMINIKKLSKYSYLQTLQSRTKNTQKTLQAKKYIESSYLTPSNLSRNIDQQKKFLTFQRKGSKSNTHQVDDTQHQLQNDVDMPRPLKQQISTKIGQRRKLYFNIKTQPQNNESSRLDSIKRMKTQNKNGQDLSLYPSSSTNKRFNKLSLNLNPTLNNSAKNPKFNLKSSRQTIFSKSEIIHNNIQLSKLNSKGSKLPSIKDRFLENQKQSKTSYYNVEILNTKVQFTQKKKNISLKCRIIFETNKYETSLSIGKGHCVFQSRDSIYLKDINQKGNIILHLISINKQKNSLVGQSILPTSSFLNKIQNPITAQLISQKVNIGKLILHYKLLHSKDGSLAYSKSRQSSQHSKSFNQKNNLVFFQSDGQITKKNINLMQKIEYSDNQQIPKKRSSKRRKLINITQPIYSQQ